MDGDALQVEGVDEAGAWFGGIRSGHQAAMDHALNDAGVTFSSEAARLAPVVSGALRNSIDYTTAANTVTVTAGSTSVPYAYTMHAVALGKSKGYMVFRVPAHSRRGYPVAAYNVVRRIRNYPFLFTAFTTKLEQVFEGFSAALDDLTGAP